MNRMRQKIASRLKEAQNVNAMLTTFNEIDMRYGIADTSVFLHKTITYTFFFFKFLNFIFIFLILALLWNLGKLIKRHS